MKILFGYLATNFRGGDKYQLDIAGAMPTAEVGFLTSNVKLNYEEKVTAIGPIHRIAPSRKFFKRLSQLKALAKEYDVLYLNMSTTHPIELLLVKLAKFRLVIFHSHATSKNLPNPIERAMFLMLHKISLAFEKYVVDLKYACSQSAADWLFGQKGAADAKIIPNGINLDKYRYSAKIREALREKMGIKGELIIHIGAFSIVKNQGYLIKAFRDFHKKHPNSVLCFVGDGEFRSDIQRSAEDLGEAVKFLGLRNDVNELLQAADLLVMPSFREGLPFVIVEAQAAGLPCLVTSTAAKECRITELCDFIDITLPPEELSRRMENQIRSERCDTRFDPNMMNYDLKAIAARIENELCSRLN